MSLDLFKAQAHRLQAYLKSHPETAQALASAKQSACYALVAAMHGVRNWNTLCAGSRQTSDVPKILETTASTGLAELKKGEVGFLVGKSGVGKSLAVVTEVLRTLAQGQTGTVLDVGRNYYRCTEAAGGANACIEEFVKTDSSLSLAHQSFEAASLATLELEGTLKGLGAADVRHAWDALEVSLSRRIGLNHLLVIDEAWAVLRAFGGHAHLLISFLANARRQGCRIVLVAQTEEALYAWKEALPPSVVLNMTGHRL